MNNVEVVYQKILERSIVDPGTMCRNITLKTFDITVSRIRYNIHKAVFLYHNRKFNFDGNATVSHSCENRKCVEISHIRYGSTWLSPKEIIYKRLKKGAIKNGDCIVANSYIDQEGRGRICVENRVYLLHRVVFWIFSNIENIDDLPETKTTGLVVRHKCRNLMCINGDHYELGTHADNADDRKRDGTQLFGDKHPKRTVTKQTAQAIADSWRPLSSKEYQTQSQRASIFNVKKSLVGHIDARTRWHELSHPNGKPPFIEEKKKRKIIAPKLDSKYWAEILRKLKAVSIPATDDNKYCGSPCWNRINNATKQPLTYQNRSKKACIWSAEYNEQRYSLQNEQARHLCQNDKCINVDHLRLGSARENATDKLIHGTYGSKLNIEDIKNIRASTKSRKKLREAYNISNSHLGNILSNKVWKDVDERISESLKELNSVLPHLKS